MNDRLRLLVTMVGNYQKNATIHAKHVFFFEALAKRFEVIDVFDAGLQGISRWVNALSVATPDRELWRIRFYKNRDAFRRRSQRAFRYLQARRNEADVALQIGATFDGTGPRAGLTPPVVIYSDYTSTLSAKKPEAGRSPFGPIECREWLALEKKALQGAAHICARSQIVRKSLIDDYQLSPERLSVIGGGLNFASLPELSSKSETAAPVALFIGKEFYRKGTDLLLKAFAKVRSQIPSARLTLIGKAVPHGYSVENVEVIDAQCDRETIGNYYRNADLFVLPSRLETWGDVLLEAMAYGLPCIGVYGDAMQEIIEDGETGFLVPSEDVDSLADRMALLMKNSQLRHSMGNAARKKIESQFLWDHVVNRLAPVLESIVLQRHVSATSSAYNDVNRSQRI